MITIERISEREHSMNFLCILQNCLPSFVRLLHCFVVTLLASLFLAGCNMKDSLRVNNRLSATVEVYQEVSDNGRKEMKFIGNVPARTQREFPNVLFGTTIYKIHIKDTVTSKTYECSAAMDDIHNSGDGLMRVIVKESQNEVSDL